MHPSEIQAVNLLWGLKLQINYLLTGMWFISLTKYGAARVWGHYRPRQANLDRVLNKNLIENFY